MNILVVDDELNIRKTLGIFLETEGHRVAMVSNPEDALAEAKRRTFDVALVDLRLGTASGMELIPQLIAQSAWIKIVVITAYASIESAVSAMKNGATDYLPKPFTPEQVRAVLNKIDEIRTLQQKVASLQESLERAAPTFLLETESATMRQAISLAQTVAKSDTAVLLRGESGTGKSELARQIHQWSARHARPFAVVSCPSLPHELLEAELFGHVKGAFTGAVRDNQGRVASADGGTLFLDEIGDLPLGLQPKLLRFLQDHSYEQVGTSITRQANIRMIAATSVDLLQAVKNGRFRDELYYRLNIFEITLPPLRERPDDTLRLAESFLAFFGKQNHRNFQGFSEQAQDTLRAYPWPGNIRELRNVVERAAILCQSEMITAEHLPLQAAARVEPAIGDSVPIEKIEELHIRRVLATAKSLEEAARILGLDTATLWRRRKQYGI